MVTEEQWNANGEATIARARTRKAEKLAKILVDHGATSTQVAALPEYGWAMAEDLAHVRPASHTTRAMVVSLLRVGEESDAELFERL